MHLILQVSVFVVQNFCDMIDMLAPVLNNAVVAQCWTVMWYVVLIPSTEISLMIMVSFVDSQSELADIKWDYLSKRLNWSSSSAASYNGSALYVWM